MSTNRIMIIATIAGVCMFALTLLLTQSAGKIKEFSSSLQKESPYRLAISKAWWGENCLKRDKGKQPMPKEVDVTSQIEGPCNQQERCSLHMDKLALGDPYPNCAEELTVSYRCFSYDKLRSVTYNAGDLVELNCDHSDLP